MCSISTFPKRLYDSYASFCDNNQDTGLDRSNQISKGLMINSNIPNIVLEQYLHLINCKDLLISKA